MSGFSPDWLRLREPVDHRARNRGLLSELGAHFAERTEITVVDLGSGLGSNLRATAPVLPPRQQWLLVDNDPALLGSACDEIASWAENSRATTSGIEAEKADVFLRVELKRHDLAAEPAAWGAVRPDLVTAAALFDLVSAQWIDRFLRALAEKNAALYAVLTHDGPVEWEPAHPADREMQAAFEQHFESDKGFGSSLGWKASQRIANGLAAAGYEVRTAPSTWVLTESERPLIAALAQGWADAVRETGAVPEATVQEWQSARSTRALCTVGHEDLLALPPRN